MNALKRLVAFNTGNVLDRSQREVNPTRAKKISNYIQDNPDSYIIPGLIGVIDRDPDFITNGKNDFVGILKIDMDSEIKLFDGQHRSTGIIDAVSSSPELGAQMIPVMLFMNMNLAERQMAFSNINGHTVKPSTSISDTYNLRNDLPKLIVEMANELDCFKDFVDFEHNVIGRNSAYLFPIKILKDATARFLGVKANSNLNDEQKQLAKDFGMACNRPLLWQSFRSWNGNSAEDFRAEYISSHGIFLNAIALTGHCLISKYGNLDKIAELSSLDIKRYSPTFEGRCIDKATGNMKTDATAIKLTAIRILQEVSCPITPELRALEKQHFPANGEQTRCATTLELLTSEYPDMSKEEIEDIHEKFAKVAQERGESENSNEFMAAVIIVLNKWNGKPHMNVRSVRGSLTDVLDVKAD